MEVSLNVGDLLMTVDNFARLEQKFASEGILCKILCARVPGRSEQTGASSAVSSKLIGLF